ncbi:MAG: stage V sporulation protein AD [Caldicoprobacterales bacterium]|jgi:stage V sporulation protein AD|nr:stage V sporulation protein AD [Clostridiales bacterium]
MLVGRQSWCFDSKPVIISSAAVGGPFESKCLLADDFDEFAEDLWLGEDSFEKAEVKLLEKACEKALEKAGLKSEDVNFMISGDLDNQITSSSFSARGLKIPYIGIFGACSTSMEGLALASKIMDNGGANYVLAATASHNAAAEKQFRYPTEYGAQKPPTSQWTVTGAGAVILGRKGDGPRVVAATIGKVIDMGISDPFNLGAAMAPAAVDTIEVHFNEFNIEPDFYDLIATGDLGFTGYSIANELLLKKGIRLRENLFTDCGMLIYGKDPKVFSGASGCACSATVTYGHLLNKMRKGELKRILVIATGALLSPMSYQQKESIPGIAHGVSIEYFY